MAKSDDTTGAIKTGEGRTLEDREILNIIDHQIDTVGADTSSERAHQRYDAYIDYYGKPRKRVEGRSDVVDMAVFEAIETIKPYLLETFTANRSVVELEPASQEDVDAASQGTRYCEHVFYRLNDGYRVLADLIHDGLLAKTGIIKRTWEESSKEVEETFGPVPRQQLEQMLGQQQDVRVTQIDSEQVPQVAPHPVTGAPVQMAVEMVSGTLVRTVDTSQVVLRVIPPENFDADDLAGSVREMDFASERTRISKGELANQGYDPDAIARAEAADANSTQYEEYGRYANDGSYVEIEGRTDTNDREEVWVRESYIRLDLDGTGQKLWQVYHTKNAIFEIEEVDEIPFEVWSPYPISHRWDGLSVADVARDIQKVRTGILRGMVDNVAITNTTRTIANLDAIRNPRDLIDNPIGGVIDAEDPSAVMPFPATQLNPLTLNIYEVIRQQQESRTGATRMSAGTNAEVISKQNAADMVEALSNNATRRIGMMARNLANVMRELFRAIYNLGVENDQKVHTVRQGGEFMQLQPSQWQPREDFTITVALTPQDGLDKAQFLLMFHQMLSQDPVNAGIYTDKQRYSVLNEALNLADVPAPDTYLRSPDDQEYQQEKMQQAQQQMQMQQMQQQIAQMQMQMAQQQQQFSQWLAVEQLKADAAHKADQQALKERAEVNDKAKDDDDVAIDAARLALDRQKFEAEVAIEREQKREASI